MLIDIPTGVLPEVIVEELPQTGEENKVYRRLVEDEDLREMQITDDFIWYDGEWLPFNFDARINGAYFSIYQESVEQTITEMEQTITEQASLIQELEEAVFPKAWVTFKMTITSLIMAHLDLYDADDNLIEEGAFTTDIYESEPMSFQTEIRKGTYYLKNSDGYALGLPNGDIKPLVYEGETLVELGNVEVIMIAPAKGGAK